jgi:uncharacterized protein (DUF1810 family)
MFVQAQDAVYPEVLRELKAGRKESHWIWFIFPQLAGLGHSQMAQRFGLLSLDEARAYLAHPILGARLKECTGIMLAQPGSDARAIMGTPDDLKFRSSMTLFDLAAPQEPIFRQALAKFFSGKADSLTIELLQPPGGG